MKKEIVIAGFGGQGVMSIGKSLVEAGLEEGLEVSWVPSYGPEMRGGTANCSVIMSDEPVGSPIVYHPTELIAMNGPSLKKFEDEVVPGGTVFLNSSIIKEKVDGKTCVLSRSLRHHCQRAGQRKGGQHGYARRLYRRHRRPEGGYSAGDDPADVHWA